MEENIPAEPQPVPEAPVATPPAPAGEKKHLMEVVTVRNWKESEEGGYYAESAGFGIFAEGETIDELKEDIKGGINCYFDKPEDAPAFIDTHTI